MESNIFRKRDTLFFKSGVYSLLSFGFLFFFFITLFIWITEKNLIDLVKVQNDEQMHSLVRQFDKNIDSYRDNLEQKSNSSTFVTTVMNPVDTEYYIKDFMDEIRIGNLVGELLLLSFNGQIINSTGHTINKVGNYYGNFEQVSGSLADRRSFQFLDSDNNVIFISSINYNGLVEGYLIFTATFKNVFNSNGHLFESLEHHHSFLALEGDNVIAKIGKSNDNYIASYYPIESLPIRLQIVTNESVINDPISKILHSIVFISVFSVLLLAIIFSIITSLLITKPLSILEYEITMVGNGESDDVPYRKKDPLEIKSLRTSFNTMQKAIIENKIELEESNSKLLKINSDLKSTQKQLVQSEKMASIGQLAAGVAHEINNPTGFVTTNLHTMKEYIGVYNSIFVLNKNLYSGLKDIITDEYIIKIVDDIYKIEEDEDFEFIMKDSVDLLEESIDGVVRIKDIVTGLRNFARPKSKISTPGNINDGIKDALRLTLNEIKYTCTVEQDLGDIPEIPCRLDQITQVFVNLLVNASHAIKEKGLIKISTWEDGNYVNASVQDNGEGIPSENLEKLFDPFFTTKEVGKGTGLGLSISYGIIEEHGGSIEVKSTVGEGTCFLMKFKISS